MPGYYALTIGNITQDLLKLYLDTFVGQSKRNYICIEHNSGKSEDEANQSYIVCKELFGLHFHIVIQYLTVRWDNDTFLIRFRQNFKNGKFQDKGIKVKNLKLFLTNLRIPTYKIIKEYHHTCELVTTYESITSLEIQEMYNENRNSCQKNRDKPSEITRLVDLLRKYKPNSQRELLDKTKNTADFLWLITIYEKKNIYHIYRRASYMLQLEAINYPVRILADTYGKAIEETDTHYALNKSIEIYIKWCEFQNIDANVLSLNIYNILDKKLSKINTLYLQGESHAGKSYIINPLKKLTVYYEELGQNSSRDSFMYRDCINKRAIFIDELQLDSQLDETVIDQFKIILEGSGTFIKSRSHRDEWLARTPCFITSNSFIWSNIPIEEIAMCNSMIIYKGLKPCPMIQNLEKDLHPLTHYRHLISNVYVDNETIDKNTLSHLIHRAVKVMVREGMDEFRNEWEDPNQLYTYTAVINKTKKHKYNQHDAAGEPETNDSQGKKIRNE